MESFKLGEVEGHWPRAGDHHLLSFLDGTSKQARWTWSSGRARVRDARSMKPRYWQIPPAPDARRARAGG